ncbi:MAG: hypothetical protein AB7G23_02985 [Vicinamibacterales bacterium]
MTRKREVWPTDRPVDATAARVVGPGEVYQSRKIGNGVDSDVPLPTRPIHASERGQKAFVDLTGRRQGLLVVIGKSPLEGRWVARCACGMYTIRRSKALTNPANREIDRCERCRQVAFLRKDSTWRQIGFNVDARAPRS